VDLRKKKNQTNVSAPKPAQKDDCFCAHYLDGRWYIFDSTRLALQTGLIRIGTGRDAADTSFATFFGPVKFLSMKVTMEPIGGQLPNYTTDAISIS
jgi:hypothetical protein